jgi:hypothetical protein
MLQTVLLRLIPLILFAATTTTSHGAEDTFHDSEGSSDNQKRELQISNLQVGFTKAIDGKFFQQIYPMTKQ